MYDLLVTPGVKGWLQPNHSWSRCFDKFLPWKISQNSQKQALLSEFLFHKVAGLEIATLLKNRHGLIFGELLDIFQVKLFRAIYDLKNCKWFFFIKNIFTKEIPAISELLKIGNKQFFKSSKNVDIYRNNRVLMFHFLFLLMVSIFHNSIVRIQLPISARYLTELLFLLLKCMFMN